MLAEIGQEPREPGRAGRALVALARGQQILERGVGGEHLDEPGLGVAHPQVLGALLVAQHPAPVALVLLELFQRTPRAQPRPRRDERGAIAHGAGGRQLHADRVEHDRPARGEVVGVALDLQHGVAEPHDRPLGEPGAPPQRAVVEQRAVARAGVFDRRVRRRHQDARVQARHGRVVQRDVVRLGPAERDRVRQRDAGLAEQELEGSTDALRQGLAAAAAEERPARDLASTRAAEHDVNRSAGAGAVPGSGCSR